MANWWPTYVAEMFALLRPGGWCQMVETYYNAQSDNGSLTDSKLLSSGLLASTGSTDWQSYLSHSPRPPPVVFELPALHEQWWVQGSESR
jgi:hypothetical protein